MSGSSGGTTWREQPSDVCETLTHETFLNSPVKAVIGSLQKGAILEVHIRKKGGATIAEALHKGKVAGTITAAIIQRLAACIEEGHEYVAEVTDNVAGGACKVHVHHK